MAAGHFAQTEKEPHKDGRLSIHTIVLCCSLVVVALVGSYLLADRHAVKIAILLALDVIVTVSVWLAIRFCGENAYMFFTNRVYPVVLVVLGLVFLFFFPPRVVPDEDYHYLKSYSYANLVFPEMDTADMREEDYRFIENEKLYNIGFSLSYWENLPESFSFFATHDGVVSVEAGEEWDTRYGDFQRLDMGVDTPQLKLASALGIVLGRVLGLSGIVVYYLGRLCNFAFGAALIILAVRLTPIGKPVLVEASLLPMTLHLLGSYSYDVGVIGFAFLAIALIMRMATGEGYASFKLRVSTIVVVMLLTPGKLIYGFIALLGLFIPSRRFVSRRAEIAWKVCILGIPFLMAMLSRFVKIISMVGVSSSQNGLTQKGDSRYYTLSDVFTNPVHMAKLVLRTFYSKADFYLQTMLGGTLGHLQNELSAPWWELFIWGGMLGCSTLPSPFDKSELDRTLRVGMVLVGIGGIVLTVLSVMVAWTFTTYNVIEGVQGRYFIPFLPCVLLAIRGKTLRASKDLMPSLLIVACAMDLLYLAQICFVVLGGSSL